MALQRVRNQIALAVVERQRPEACRWCDSRDNDLAPAIERPLRVIGLGEKSYAVSGSDR